MSRPLPVDLLMAATGAVLLVSGIGGEPIGEVLKGQYGDLTGTKQAGQATAAATAAGSAQDVAMGGGGSESETQSSPSSSTFAPSPDTFHRHVSRQQELKSIAAILLHEGIRNPTHQQIEDARRLYHSQ